MPEKNLYTTLTRKICLLMLVVSLTPLLLLSVLAAYHFHTAYRAKVMAHLHEIASKHRQSIDSFLQERLANIRVLLEAVPLEDLMKQKFAHELLDTLQARYGGEFVDIGLVDETGVQVAYAGPFQLREVNYANADWYRKALKNNYFISDVFLGIRRQPHFIVAAHRSWQGRDYILRATIDFESFNRLVEQFRIGETGLAFIVGRDGAFQTKPRVDLSGCGEDILGLVTSSLGDRWGTEPHPASAISDICDGKSAVYVMTTLKGGDWVLVYRQEEADAFSDLYSMRLYALILLGLSTTVLVFAAMLLSRRMVAYIAKVDADKEAMNAQIIEASKMASLGEMAAGFAHEINNPVAVMVEEAGWVDDLLEDFENDGKLDMEECRRALAQVKTQGERCRDITQKLLSFARKGDPERRELDINEVMEETTGLMTHRARLAGVELSNDLDGDLPPVIASHGELSQVLVNLINNALDAMEPKGGHIVLSSLCHGECVELQVRDDGPGIPESILSRIFDPFFTTKPVGRGTGLGLAVCYGIVKNLGGEIFVTSEGGNGSLFRVLLPSKGYGGEVFRRFPGLRDDTPGPCADKSTADAGRDCKDIAS